jgi:hypothetical protein
MMTPADHAANIRAAIEAAKDSGCQVGFHSGDYDDPQVFVTMSLFVNRREGGIMRRKFEEEIESGWT